jgi:zinc and cadmium transporter
VVTTVGIVVIGRHEKWGIDNAAYFMSFAAGVLISVSFIHIIPKSFAMNTSVPLFLSAGFLTLQLFNRFLRGPTFAKNSDVKILPWASSRC